MRRAYLFLLLILPLMAAAQDKDRSSVQNGAISSNDTAEAGGSSAPAQKNGSTSEPSKRTSKPKPEIPGSMVGSIDNPIVAWQVRIRFDDDFEDWFPDRSEFFYAKCACFKLLSGTPLLDPNAPGPGPAVPTAVNYQQLYFNGEYSPHRRFSLFAEVPIRWLQPQGPPLNPPGFSPLFPNQSGLSDV